MSDVKEVTKRWLFESEALKKGDRIVFNDDYEHSPPKGTKGTVDSVAGDFVHVSTKYFSNRKFHKSEVDKSETQAEAEPGDVMYKQRKLHIAVEDVEKGLLSAKIGLQDIMDLTGGSIGIALNEMLDIIVKQQKLFKDIVEKHSDLKKAARS